MAENESRIINLPQLSDSRGELSFMEIGNQFEKPIENISWFYAEYVELKKDNQIIIVLAGSLELKLDSKSLKLDQANLALYISETSKAEIKSFSDDSIFIIASLGENDKEMEVDNKCSPYKICNLVNFPNNRTKNLPFPIKRFFYIYNIPNNTTRGVHANIDCHEILIALNGAFDIELDDGADKSKIRLDNSKQGLHIPPGIWAKETAYAPNTICLAIASERYNKDGYIDNYEDFLKYKKRCK